MNRAHLSLMIVESEMAQVATGILAADTMWARLASLARKPVVSLDMLDALCEELREMQAGLAAGQRALQRERETV